MGAVGPEQNFRELSPETSAKNDTPNSELPQETHCTCILQRYQPRLERPHQKTKTSASRAGDKRRDAVDPVRWICLATKVSKRELSRRSPRLAKAKLQEASLSPRQAARIGDTIAAQVSSTATLCRSSGEAFSGEEMEGVEDRDVESNRRNRLKLNPRETAFSDHEHGIFHIPDLPNYVRAPVSSHYSEGSSSADSVATCWSTTRQIDSASAITSVSGNDQELYSQGKERFITGPDGGLHTHDLAFPSEGTNVDKALATAYCKGFEAGYLQAEVDFMNSREDSPSDDGTFLDGP